jgi:8-oxo-dGTP pyrophosphatase MutT (NUDIX family)
LELVDVYNKRHEKLGLTKERNELVYGEYRLSCYAYIINNDDQILIQQRVGTVENAPNMWETLSGGAVSGDTSLSGTIREIEEELGIKANPDDMTFIGSYIRHKDFVEIWLLKSNVKIEELKLEQDELQSAKWVSISEFEDMLEKKEAVSSAFKIFKNYYTEFYKN